MQRYKKFNPKRRIAAPELIDRDNRRKLADRLVYSGNPEHKRNPGDFGLIPPSQPRRGKSLCDSAAIYTRSEALRYLKIGLEKGAISETLIDGWPKIIWAVTGDGIPLEAQKDGDCSYHGYPMPLEDPMSSEIKKFWKMA
jgi:hypothetical protein